MIVGAYQSTVRGCFIKIYLVMKSTESSCFGLKHLSAQGNISRVNTDSQPLTEKKLKEQSSHSPPLPAALKRHEGGRERERERKRL